MAEQRRLPPHLGRFFLTAVLTLHVVLVGRAALLHFPNIDEMAHVTAGVSHWQLGTFDLYRVNPPLVRMVATMPVVISGGRGDFRGYRDTIWERQEFTFAKNFYGLEAPRWLRYTFIARFGCLPFTLLGAMVVYRWGYQLWGRGAGLVTAAIWSLDPTIVANAQTINPDVGAAAVGLWAGYVFWLWLRDPSWQRALTCGTVLGLAQLTRSTWLILFGLWPLLSLIYHGRPLAAGSPTGRHLFAQISVILFLGVLVLNLGYGFEGTLKPAGSYTFLSQALSGQRAPGMEGNRLQGTWLEDMAVPLPSNYVQGADYIRYEFERTYASYLGGKWKDGGWWYYYLYAAAIKIPLGYWLLLAVAAVIPLADAQYRIPLKDATALLLPGIVFFALVSSQTGFNHHFRYALPGVPYFFVFAGLVGRSLELRRRWLPLVTVTCLGWAALSGLLVYPHSLSYFNELVGGPPKGHLHLLNSNIDWGQDLLFLKKWMDRHPHARPIGILAFHQVAPGSAGIRDYTEPNAWPPERGNHPFGPPTRATVGPQPGWYAVSVNYLQGYVKAAQAAKFGFHAPDAPRYTYFQHFTPVDRIGYSMNIYHVTLEECNELRRALRLKELPEDWTRSADAW